MLCQCHGRQENLSTGSAFSRKTIHRNECLRRWHPRAGMRMLGEADIFPCGEVHPLTSREEIGRVPRRVGACLSCRQRLWENAGSPPWLIQPSHRTRRAAWRDRGEPLSRPSARVLYKGECIVCHKCTTARTRHQSVPPGSASRLHTSILRRLYLCPADHGHVDRI